VGWAGFDRAARAEVAALGLALGVVLASAAGGAASGASQPSAMLGIASHASAHFM
jgi:hypothetical protein